MPAPPNNTKVFRSVEATRYFEWKIATEQEGHDSAQGQWESVGFPHGIRDRDDLYIWFQSLVFMRKDEDAPNRSLQMRRQPFR
jgi:hypothetical protein